MKRERERDRLKESLEREKKERRRCTYTAYVKSGDVEGPERKRKETLRIAFSRLLSLSIDEFLFAGRSSPS